MQIFSINEYNQHFAKISQIIQYTIRCRKIIFAFYVFFIIAVMLSQASYMTYGHTLNMLFIRYTILYKHHACCSSMCKRRYAFCVLRLNKSCPRQKNIHPEHGKNQRACNWCSSNVTHPRNFKFSLKISKLNINN